jgi:hypothetical protein
MRPEYALARVAPEIGKYEARLPGGVLVSWEDCDAGHAMAGSPNWCRDLVLTKWAGAPYRLSIALGAGSIAASKADYSPKWGIMVAHAAAQECIRNRQCPVCDGRGVVKEPGDDLLTDCESCEGHGVTRWTNDQRAELIGTTEREFRNRYYKFHQECLRVLVQGELETLSSMAYRLNR